MEYFDIKNIWQFQVNILLRPTQEMMLMVQLGALDLRDWAIW